MEVKETDSDNDSLTDRRGKEETKFLSDTTFAQHFLSARVS